MVFINREQFEDLYFNDSELKNKIDELRADKEFMSSAKWLLSAIKKQKDEEEGR